MKFLAAIFFGLVLLAGSGWAHTMSQQNFACPVCEKKFTQVMDGSGTQFGQQLDLRPLGPTPAPWAIPVCPQCHFVLLKEPDETYSPAELVDFRAFVETAAYRQAGKQDSSYYLLALLQEHLGSPNSNIGYSYLRASWQADGDADRQKHYLQRTLEKYAAALADTGRPLEADTAVTAKLVVGECFRRLGRFAEAAAHFAKLGQDPAFADGLLAGIVQQQVALVKARDSAPHAIEDKTHPERG